jgi:hypothetical protein
MNSFFVSVPRHFERERPSVMFTEEHYSMPMKDHPVASQFPQAGSHPSIHPGPETFRSLAVHNESPKSVTGFLWKKNPFIHLHVVTFDDATLVSLLWPHVMCDCIGWAIILRSWAAIVAGRGHNVPKFNGYYRDAMERLGKTPQPKKSVLETRLATLAGVKAKGGRIIQSLSFVPHKMESRIFCLPAEFLQKTYGAAVSAVPHDFHLSEDDVITAWATQILCKRMPTSSRAMAICKFFDSRPLLPEVFSKHGVYVQNASFPYVARMTAASICSNPISNVAKEVRLAFHEQARRDQLLSLAELMRKDHIANKIPLLARLDAHPVIFINWNKANIWSTVDFTAATLPSGEAEDNGDTISPEVRARPVYFHSDLVGEHDLSQHEVFAMYGKDPKGNFWMSASLRRESMRCFEREFHKISSK